MLLSQCCHNVVTMAEINNNSLKTKKNNYHETLLSPSNNL